MNEIILVIDDNREICENIAEILSIGGYDVLTALNGKSGIEKALKHKPSLVLCDVMMPELDGYGVLHVLTKHPDTADIPFIFLTAKSEKADFRKGMAMGADDYIVKPFEGLELLEAVSLRLKKAAQLKTAFDSRSGGIDDFLDKADQLSGFQGASLGRPRRAFKKKDHIFMEGQRPNELYYIISGEVKTSSMNPDGKELITGVYREGQFVGYESLLEGKPYTESAVALTVTEVGIISSRDFQTLIHTDREVAAQFIKILTHSLSEAKKRMLELAYQSVRQRVASSLIYLSQPHSADKAPLITVFRKDIASIVGTALESLNRTLADFRNEQLINLTDQGIEILDMEKLKRVSQ